MVGDRRDHRTAEGESVAAALVRAEPPASGHCFVHRAADERMSEAEAPGNIGLADEIQARIRKKVSALLEERRLQTLTDNIESLRPLLFEETAPAVARDVARDVAREAETAKTDRDVAEPARDRAPSADLPVVDPDRTRSTAPSDS